MEPPLPHRCGEAWLSKRHAARKAFRFTVPAGATAPARPLAAYGLVRGASRTSAAQVRSLPRTRSVRTSSAALDSESQFVGVTGEKLDEADDPRSKAAAK
jgi:hypothetical protein